MRLLGTFLRNVGASTRCQLARSQIKKKREEKERNTMKEMQRRLDAGRPEKKLSTSRSSSRWNEPAAKMEVPRFARLGREDGSRSGQ